jgi:hypothetical protein
MDPPPALAVARLLAMLITTYVVVSCWCNSLDFSGSIERDSTAFRNTRRDSVDRGFQSRQAALP